MSLTFESQICQGGIIVHLTGKFDFSVQQMFLEAMQRYGRGYPRLFIDVENVSSIDSAGIGILASFIKRHRSDDDDQEVKIVNPRGQVRSSLLLTNFSAYSPVVDTDERYSTFTDIS